VQIAVQTVQEYLEETPDSSVKNVIFNVFKNEDLQIYERILRS
jgi:O-acetyl-ADP-ribose deacetylase (regulator of RNase III)